jgi:hypothetical protein
LAAIRALRQAVGRGPHFKRGEMRRLEVIRVQMGYEHPIQRIEKTRVGTK